MRLEIFLFFLLSLFVDLSILKLAWYPMRERYVGSRLLIKEGFKNRFVLLMLFGIPFVEFLIATFTWLSPLVRVLAVSLLPLCILKVFLLLYWHRGSFDKGKWAFQLAVPLAFLSVGWALLPPLFLGVKPVCPSNSFYILNLANLLFYAAVGVPVIAVFFAYALIKGRGLQKWLTPALSFTIVPSLVDRISDFLLRETFLPILWETPIFSFTILSPLTFLMWLVTSLILRNN